MGVIWIDSRRFAAAAGWTPAQISTALWLDAADSSTITTVSGAVSQWNDKSGNNRHATQATSGSRPAYTSSGLNGLNVVTFDGSNDFMDVTTTLFQGIGSFQLHWIFARLGNGLSNDGYTPSLAATEGSADRGAFHYVKSDNVGASYPFFGYGWNQYDGVGTYTTNQANLMSFVAGSSTWSVLRNGTTEGSNNRGSAPSGITALRLAQQQSPVRTANIYLAELVMTLSDSSTTRQQVEGYLAHKWGLTANLPAGHPYKTTPP